MNDIVDRSSLTGDQVVVSPPDVATACNGQTLELMCSTPGRVLQWSFALNQTNENFVRFPSTQSFQFLGPSSHQTHHVFINPVNYTYLRLSPPDILPLVTKLVISPVNESFNGTEVTCTDVENSVSSSTVIHVVHEDQVDGWSNKVMFARSTLY